MTDPHVVRKIIERREDDIRPCVGANYCLDRIYQGGAAFCIHNAATGRETTMPHGIPPAPAKRKVVIVGAGPAGLEAARVAGERGHEVVRIAIPAMSPIANVVRRVPRGGFDTLRRRCEVREHRRRTRRVLPGDRAKGPTTRRKRPGLGMRGAVVSEARE